MKQDEREYLGAVFRAHGGRAYRGHGGDAPFVRRGADEVPMADEVAGSCGIHGKRAGYLVDKWSTKGWWEYGVSRRTGWFTPRGIEAISKLLESP